MQKQEDAKECPLFLTLGNSPVPWQVVEGTKVERPGYGAHIAHLRSVPADRQRDSKIAFLPPEFASAGTASEVGSAIGFLSEEAMSEAGRTDRAGLSYGGSASSVQEGRMFDAQSVAGSDIGFIIAPGGGGGGGINFMQEPGGINFMQDGAGPGRAAAAGPPSLLNFLGTDARGAPQSERRGSSSYATSSVAETSVAGSTAQGGKKRTTAHGGTTARDEMSKRSSEKRSKKKEGKGRFNA